MSDEWLDVTTFGDTNRTFVRGLSREDETARTTRLLRESIDTIRKELNVSNGNGQSAGDQMITVKELLERIDATVDGMGQQNPNRVLFMQCRTAIAFLASKMPDESVITRSGLILP